MCDFITDVIFKHFLTLFVSWTL